MMEGIFVPIPNQPLYVWPIRTSAIFSRGFVRGNRRLMSLGMHGHILLGGSQNILPVYPSTDFRIAKKIFMYGYPLYTWYGRTSYGGSRYRILFIVWIWNYIVSNINIIAQAGAVDQYTRVIAETAIDTHFLNLTYFYMPHNEIDQEGHVAYIIDKEKYHHQYILSSAVNSSPETQLNLLTNLRQFTERLANVGISTHESAEILAKLRIATLPETQTTYKLIANTMPVYTEDTFKLTASLVTSDLERTISLLVQTPQGQYENVAKLQVQVNRSLIERVAKLQISTPVAQLDQVTKLKVSTLPPIQERVAKFKISTLPEQIRQIKLSVHPQPNEIEEVREFICTNVESHFHSDDMHIRGNLGAHAKNIINIRSFYGAHVDNPIKLLSLLHNYTQQQGTVSLQTDKHVYENKDTQFLAIPVERRNHKIHVQSRKEQATESIVTGAMLEPKTEHKRFLYQIHPYSQKVNVFLNPIVLQEQWHRIELDVLPLLAERRIQFFPSLAPLVEQIGVMVSVCKTHILSYLNFVPDELKESVDVLISQCSYTTASLLEWFLHGNRITNEGGNEIIFDLGEVDPIGPIPPVPSRQWEGGYVEDPFKGVSYQPNSDSTGFGSPSAEKWVSNVQMWWGSTSNPWVDPSSNE